MVATVKTSHGSVTVSTTPSTGIVLQAMRWGTAVALSLSPSDAAALRAALAAAILQAAPLVQEAL